jgi:hypothetical protein
LLSNYDESDLVDIQLMCPFYLSQIVGGMGILPMTIHGSRQRQDATTFPSALFALSAVSN